MNEIRLHFFDSGGTLPGPGTGPDHTPDPVAAGSSIRVHAPLSGMGVDIDPERVRETLVQQAKACRQRVSKAYNFHQLMIAAVEESGLPPGPEAAACLVDVCAGPRYASWLFPGTVDALRTLSETGFRLDIIADTAWPGFSMDRAFAGAGLLSLLDIRPYSGEIGVEKPGPAIFRLAERAWRAREKTRSLRRQ